MSLTKFDIHLHNPKSVFTGGDLISGEVIVDLSRTKSCRGVKLKFIGRAKVHWSETHRRNKQSHTVHFVGDESYFDTTIYVIGSEDGEVELVPGHHIFPFTFPLPLNIPDTFEHNLGYVCYSIKAVIDRPWKFDHETKRDLRVETPYDISQYNQRRIEDEVNESFCCCILPCISQGNIEATIRLPTNAYVIGDSIKAFITIDFQSGSVSVTEIKLKLIQRMEFHARSPNYKTKTDENTIQRVTQGGMMVTGHEYTVGMQVPSVPPSGFQHCGIIDINYKLEVTLVISGCHCDIEKSYEIVIGSYDSRAPHYQPAEIIGVSQPTAPIDGPSEYTPAEAVKAPLLPNITENPMPPSSAPYPLYPPNAPSEFAGPSASAPIGFHVPGAGMPMPNSGMPMPMPIPSAPDGLPPSYDAVMAESAKK